MEYSTYDVERYLPSLNEALAQGDRSLKAISCFFDIQDPSLKILEIGCASGSFLRVLQEKGFDSIHGIDIDQELISHGKSMLGLNIQVADWATYIANTTESYDLIVALDVFEHLSPTEVQQILKMTCDRLTSRGKLIMRMPNPACPFVLPTFCGDLTHKLLATSELIRYMLSRAGFAGVITFRETYPHDRFKKILYLAVHYLIVKPLVILFYYHFYGGKPGPITRNMYCCAVRGEELR